MRIWLRAVLVSLLAGALAAGAAAGELPGRARLARDSGTGVVGGYQNASGANGEFSLFAFDLSTRTGGNLGRYNGQLAGVLPGPTPGTLIALTSDGAMGVYGDESAVLTLPDGRWHMLDLTLHEGRPLALHYDEQSGEMLTARPDGKEGWTVAERPAARDTGVAKATLVPWGEELHLLWISRSYDMTKGTIRHAVLRDGEWTELQPLATGDVGTFAAFVGVERPLSLFGVKKPERRFFALTAIVPDPVDPSKKRILALGWDGDEWSATKFIGALPKEKALIAGDLAAVFDGDVRDWQTVWLVASRDGAFLEHTQGVFELDGARDVDVNAALPGLVSLGMLLAFVLLLVLYARRSRLLSRLQPGRPSDLVSRGVALTIDWVLVSVGMTAYHYATGDVRVLERLTTLESMNKLFWINLGALALYAAFFEGRYGRTPGKYLCGLRVRSALGGPPGFLQCLVRNAMRAVDMFPLPIAVPGLVGMIAALLNVRRQRVGDRLAATVVRRHAPILKRDFLLASASPRRLELLDALGVDIEVEPADIDEDAVQGNDPEHTARLLAEAKASTVASRLRHMGPVVVAADTMVVLDGEVLGKPADAAEATRMLERLSGRSHTVVTGVTVWDSLTGQGLSDAEVTEVEFRTLSFREIESYVASGDPMDKAGAYGIQSGNLVKQVRGSLSNVAGLPMEKLQGLLHMLDS